MLRDRRLARLKFRRQHLNGQFVLDLFCVEHQLVLEVDGEIHRDPEQTARDAARTELLASRGLRVLRFTNDESENHVDEVLERILAATRSWGLPAPSPPTPTPGAQTTRSGSGEHLHVELGPVPSPGVCAGRAPQRSCGGLHTG